jgi:hypothetical protein
MTISNNIPNFSDLRAGSAVVTVDNGKGEHVTFKVSAPRKGNQIDHSANVRFVSIMLGSDNDTFKYVGVLTQSGIKVTKASKLPANHKRVVVAAWAVRACVTQTLPAGYSIRHEGTCLRCGRKLTNPDSINTMYGPECANRINISKPVANKVVAL